MIWFTADTHFNHNNIIRYCNRPYSTVEEMNKDLIANWNACVNPRDTIYHLGDFAFPRPGDEIKKLNGKIWLVKGSHDRHMRAVEQYLAGVLEGYAEITVHDQRIVLCHYAMRTWPRSHYGSWHLYGHSHGRLPPHGKSYDVGVDNNLYYPLSFDQVKDIMEELPDTYILKKGGC